MERQVRVGRDDFRIDPARQRQDNERYDEGRGLIGGDPAKRPAHIRWRPIPEEQPYFRLIDISDEKRRRLDAFLGRVLGGTEGNSEELHGPVDAVENGQSGRPLEVEIGFGTGEFLLGRAQAQPGRRFLGFEVKRDLCRGMVKSVRRAALENVWISDDDARWALPQLGLDGQVEVIHVLYPDPWWKRRHHSKRIFSPPFVELVHRLLIPGGLLHVRSDVNGYARLIEQTIAGHGGFLANHADRAAAFDNDPPTRREAYCRSIQRPYWIMAFPKRS